MAHSLLRVMIAVPKLLDEKSDFISSNPKFEKEKRRNTGNQNPQMTFKYCIYRDC